VDVQVTDETRFESETGGAKGMKLLRFDQIPAGPMAELAARYGLGSTKYAQKNGLDNWRNGYPFSLSMAALERHYYAFKNGEDYDATIYAEAGLLADGEHPLYDEEGKLRPGITHLSAVVWHCFFLMHHLVENPHLDDRPSTVLRRNAEAKQNVDLATNAELALEWIGDGRSESDTEDRLNAIFELRRTGWTDDIRNWIDAINEGAAQEYKPTPAQQRSTQRMAKIRERLPQAIAEELAEDDLKLADVYQVVGTTTPAELTQEEMDAEESTLIKNWGPGTQSKLAGPITGALYSSDGSKQGAVGLYQFMPPGAYPYHFIAGSSERPKLSPTMQSVMDTLKKKLAILYPEAEQVDHSEWLNAKLPDDGDGTVTLKLKDIDPETMRLTHGGTPYGVPPARTEAEVEALHDFKELPYEIGDEVVFKVAGGFTVAGKIDAQMPGSAPDGGNQYLVRVTEPWSRPFETIHENDFVIFRKGTGTTPDLSDPEAQKDVQDELQIQDEALKNAVQQSLDRD
jgi:hypothetical protein